MGLPTGWEQQYERLVRKGSGRVGAAGRPVDRGVHERSWHEKRATAGREKLHFGQQREALVTAHHESGAVAVLLILKAKLVHFSLHHDSEQASIIKVTRHSNGLAPLLLGNGLVLHLNLQLLPVDEQSHLGLASQAPRHGLDVKQHWFFVLDKIQRGTGDARVGAHNH